MLSSNTLWSLFYTNHRVQQSNLISSRESHLVHWTSDHFPPVADPGGGPPLFLDKTDPQRAKKIFLETPHPPPPPPPPHLKVWIRHCLLSIFLSVLCMITSIWVGCPEHFTMLPPQTGVVHSSSCACGEVVHLTFGIFTQQAIFLRSVMTWWILIICSCAVLTCCTQTLYIQRIARICWIQTLKVISEYFLRIRTAFLGLKLVRNANEWLHIKIINMWLSFIWTVGWRKKKYWSECCTSIAEVRVGIPASLNVFSGFLFTTAKLRI